VTSSKNHQQAAPAKGARLFAKSGSAQRMVLVNELSVCTRSRVLLSVCGADTRQNLSVSSADAEQITEWSGE